jgi:hypothetical protein
MRDQSNTISANGSRITLMAMSMPIFRAATEGCERLHMADLSLGFYPSAANTTRTIATAPRINETARTSIAPAATAEVAPMASKRRSRLRDQSHKSPATMAESTASQIMGQSLAAPSAPAQ